MLIKKAGDLRYSDITPKSVYLNRRQFLMASAGGIPRGACRKATAKLAECRRRARSAPPSRSRPPKYVTTYNNFYEFGTEQEPAGEERRRTSNVAVDRLRRRRLRQAAQVLDSTRS